MRFKRRMQRKPDASQTRSNWNTTTQHESKTALTEAGDASGRIAATRQGLNFRAYGVVLTLGIATINFVSFSFYSFYLFIYFSCLKFKYPKTLWGIRFQKIQSEALPSFLLFCPRTNEIASVHIFCFWWNVHLLEMSLTCLKPMPKKGAWYWVCRLCDGFLGFEKVWWR